MADIVIGIASSHTPQLSSGVEMWPDHAERDRRNPLLLGTDARFHTYDELLARADPALGKELAPEVWERKYRRCQEAIDALSTFLDKAHPDVAVVIGDDQRELFRDDGIPALACFTGPQLVDMPPSAEAAERMPKGIRAASWAAHADHPESHPVHSALSAHIAERLSRDDFDLTVFTQQPAGRSLGHAFTFPRYRLGLARDTPIVPVFVNTYYPPNVPSAARCYDLGRTLRRAVESWPAGDRVAVIASGGLSHFVVDEQLDRRVLAGITGRDAGILGSLSPDQLRSGTSEILNWIVAAGALENLAATVLDYVPGYRTPAGTGAGMAFARWE
jgi:3-O-methylgallate 3,4-dioxygenase